MRVTLRLEQAVWMQLLARAHEEGLSADDVVNAWCKRAVRQTGTVLPTEQKRARVVEMPR